MILNFLKSGYMFFFRWPVVTPKTYYPSSILLAPFLQSAVAFLFFYFFEWLNFTNPLSIFLTLFCLSLATGFFHDDGFADTFDSLGVVKFNNEPATLEKIKYAMKDSRLGSFGVSGLVFLWGVRYFFATSLVPQPVYLILTIGLSRSGGLLLGKLTSLKVETKHESILHTNLFLFWIVFLFWLVVAVFYVNILAWFVVPFVLCRHLLKGLASRTSELSGDLVGFIIISLEILAFLLILKNA
jgi:cobalamin synthase